MLLALLLLFTLLALWHICLYTIYWELYALTALVGIGGQIILLRLLQILEHRVAVLILMIIQTYVVETTGG